MEHDKKYWKLSRFIRDSHDMADVEALYVEYFPMINKLFHHLIAKSTIYPSIGSNDFTLFSHKCNFLDSNLIQSRIDQLFGAVNFEVEN